MGRYVPIYHTGTLFVPTFYTGAFLSKNTPPSLDYHHPHSLNQRHSDSEKLLLYFISNISFHKIADMPTVQPKYYWDVIKYGWRKDCGKSRETTVRKVGPRLEFEMNDN
jgi:hypothetical protein